MSIAPRIILFGIRCRFTELVLQGFAHQQHTLVATVMPGPPRLDHPTRISPPRRSLPLAGARPDPFSTVGIPVYQVPRLSSHETLEVVRSLQPDVIVVACFPRIIPRVIRVIPNLAAINIHPSLLPAHRGPDPLFWILREGSGQAGVTVHELADRLDAGPILAQRTLQYEDGLPEPALEQRLAEMGATLAGDVIDALADGTAIGAVQDESRASYESWPTEDDYVMDTRRSARSAFNFVRGIQHRGVPVRVATDEGRIVVEEALAYCEDKPLPDDTPDGAVAIGFEPGWLLVRPQPS